MEMNTNVLASSAELVPLLGNISQDTQGSYDTRLNKASLPMQNFTNGLPECYVRLVHLPENVTPNQAVKANELNSFECVNTSQQHIASQKCHYIELDNHLSYCLTCKLLIQDFRQFKQSRGNQSSLCKSSFNRHKGSECRGLSVYDDKSSVAAAETELNINENDENIFNKVYKCTICQKRFIHEGSFIDHMKSHTNEESFKYPACEYSVNEILETTDPIVARTQNLKEGSAYTEEDEHKDVELKNQEICVNKAIKIETETNSKIICSTAEPHFKMFSNASEEDTLEPHFEDFNIETSKSNDLIVAVNLKQDFEEEDEFKKNVQSQGNESFFCSSIFDNHNQSSNVAVEAKFMGTEQNGNKVSTNKTVACPICNKRIVKANLKRHKFTHTGEKPFKCNICQKRYTAKESLEYHLKTHTGEKPFRCRHCDYSAKLKKEVQRHYHLMHTVNVAKSDTKKTVCPICNIRITNLKRHMLTHTGEKPFQCSICQKCYSAKRSLEYHIKSHTGEKPFRCTECDYSTNIKEQVRKHYNRIHGFKLANSEGNIVKPKKKVCPVCNIKVFRLKPHMLTHTSEKPFQCNICQKCFRFEMSLKYHIKSHTEEKPFRCTECDYSAKTMRHLRQHYNQMHVTEVVNSDEMVNTKKTIICQICNKKILALNLRYHISCHLGEKPFKCKICQKDYMSKHSLEFHLKSHSGEKPFRCTECDYSAKLNKQVRLHYNRIHAVKVANSEGNIVKRKKKRVCPICNINVLDLKRHMGTHSGEKPFECNICHNRYTTKNSLKHHIQSHTEEKRFRCRECDYSTKMERYLREHYNLMHTTKVANSDETVNTKKTSVYRICNKKILDVNLKDHISSHTGEKPYKCNLCEKGYMSRNSLEYHLKSHTGEKPFRCTECDYSAKLNKQVREHYNRRHTVKPKNVYTKKAVCPICNIRILQLKRHMLTHTGEKPFGCHICPNRYTTKNSLEYHIKSHTGESPFCCSECDYSAKTNKQVRYHFNRIHRDKVKCAKTSDISHPLKPHFQNIKIEILEATDATSEPHFDTLNNTSEEDTPEPHLPSIESNAFPPTDSTSELHFDTLSNTFDEDMHKPHFQNIKSEILDATYPPSKPRFASEEEPRKSPPQNAKSNVLEAVGPTVAVNFERNFEEPEHIQSSINNKVEVKDKATHTKSNTKTSKATDLEEWPENLETIKSEEIQIEDELICEDNPVFTVVGEYEPHHL